MRRPVEIAREPGIYYERCKLERRIARCGWRSPKSSQPLGPAILKECLELKQAIDAFWNLHPPTRLEVDLTASQLESQDARPPVHAYVRGGNAIGNTGQRQRSNYSVATASGTYTAADAGGAVEELVADLAGPSTGPAAAAHVQPEGSASGGQQGSHPGRRRAQPPDIQDDECLQHTARKRVRLRVSPKSTDARATGAAGQRAAAASEPEAGAAGADRGSPRGAAVGAPTAGAATALAAAEAAEVAMAAAHMQQRQQHQQQGSSGTDTDVIDLVTESTPEGDGEVAADLGDDAASNGPASEREEQPHTARGDKLPAAKRADATEEDVATVAAAARAAASPTAGPIGGTGMDYGNVGCTTFANQLVAPAAMAPAAAATGPAAAAEAAAAAATAAAEAVADARGEQATVAGARAAPGEAAAAGTDPCVSPAAQEPSVAPAVSGPVAANAGSGFAMEASGIDPQPPCHDTPAGALKPPSGADTAAAITTDLSSVPAAVSELPVAAAEPPSRPVLPPAEQPALCLATRAGMMNRMRTSWGRKLVAGASDAALLGLRGSSAPEGFPSKTWGGCKLEARLRQLQIQQTREQLQQRRCQHMQQQQQPQQPMAEATLPSQEPEAQPLPPPPQQPQQEQRLSADSPAQLQGQGAEPPPQVPWQEAEELAPQPGQKVMEAIRAEEESAQPLGERLGSEANPQRSWHPQGQGMDEHLQGKEGEQPQGQEGPQQLPEPQAANTEAMPLLSPLQQQQQERAEPPETEAQAQAVADLLQPVGAEAEMTDGQQLPQPQEQGVPSLPLHQHQLEMSATFDRGQPPPALCRHQPAEAKPLPYLSSVELGPLCALDLRNSAMSPSRPRLPTSLLFKLQGASSGLQLAGQSQEAPAPQLGALVDKGVLPQLGAGMQGDADAGLQLSHPLDSAAVLLGQPAGLFKLHRPLGQSQQQSPPSTPQQQQQQPQPRHWPCSPASRQPPQHPGCPGASGRGGGLINAGHELHPCQPPPQQQQQQQQQLLFPQDLVAAALAATAAQPAASTQPMDVLDALREADAHVLAALAAACTSAMDTVNVPVAGLSQTTLHTRRSCALSPPVPAAALAGAAAGPCGGGVHNGAAVGGDEVSSLPTLQRWLDRWASAGEEHAAAAAAGDPTSSGAAAVLNLRGASIRGDGWPGSCLWVRGGGRAVTICNGRIDGLASVVVEQGANVTFEGVHLTAVAPPPPRAPAATGGAGGVRGGVSPEELWSAAVVVQGAGSRAAFKSCKVVVNTSIPVARTGLSMATAATGGGNVKLASRFGCVLALGGGTVELSGRCELVGGPCFGLAAVGPGSEGRAELATATGAGTAGFLAAHGGQLAAVKCSVRQVTASGILLTAGGGEVMGVGFAAVDSGRVSTDQCEAQYCTYSGFLSAGPGALLTSVGRCLSRKNGWAGFACMDRATLRTGPDCCATANSVAGFASYAGAALTASECCRAEDNGGPGWCASVGAWLVAGRKCCAIRNGFGRAGGGGFVSDEGSVVFAGPGCESKGNCGAGWQALDRSQLVAGEDSGASRNGDCGFAADTGGRVVLGPGGEAADNGRAGFAAMADAVMVVGKGAIARTNASDGFCASRGGRLDASAGHARALKNGEHGFCSEGPESVLVVGPGSSARGHEVGWGALARASSVLLLCADWCAEGNAAGAMGQEGNGKLRLSRVGREE